MLRCEEAALGGGTAITVRDLFYNVPARRKFLRTEPTELAHIASLVTHYSLAHPDKTFLLTSGPTELLHVTPVATLKERVYQVFGSQVLDELVEIGAREKRAVPAAAQRAAFRSHRRIPARDRRAGPAARTFRLTGFFSRPQVQKANRNSIFIFVNGRLIRDRLLLHALSSAYHNLMPASAYPFALLFLECDAEEVDVNVHPSKTEVRFRHGIVRARFRPRHHPRAPHGEPPGALFFAAPRAAPPLHSRPRACPTRNSARCWRTKRPPRPA